MQLLQSDSLGRRLDLCDAIIIASRLLNIVLYIQTTNIYTLLSLSLDCTGKERDVSIATDEKVIIAIEFTRSTEYRRSSIERSQWIGPYRTGERNAFELPTRAHSLSHKPSASLRRHCSFCYGIPPSVVPFDWLPAHELIHRRITAEYSVVCK